MARKIFRDPQDCRFKLEFRRRRKSSVGHTPFSGEARRHPGIPAESQAAHVAVKQADRIVRGRWQVVGCKVLRGRELWRHLARKGFLPFSLGSCWRSSLFGDAEHFGHFRRQRYPNMSGCPWQVPGQVFQEAQQTESFLYPDHRSVKAVLRMSATTRTIKWSCKQTTARFSQQTQRTVKG